MTGVKKTNSMLQVILRTIIPLSGSLDLVTVVKSTHAHRSLVIELWLDVLFGSTLLLFCIHSYSM